MKFVIGKETAREPEVRFWLEERGNKSVALMAKADDGREQNVIIIEQQSVGPVMVIKSLACRPLCDAFNIAQGGPIKHRQEG